MFSAAYEHVNTTQCPLHKSNMYYGGSSGSVDSSGSGGNGSGGGGVFWGLGAAYKLGLQSLGVVFER